MIILNWTTIYKLLIIIQKLVIITFLNYYYNFELINKKIF